MREYRWKEKSIATPCNHNLLTAHIIQDQGIRVGSSMSIINSSLEPLMVALPLVASKQAGRQVEQGTRCNVPMYFIFLSIPRNNQIKLNHLIYQHPQIRRNLLQNLPRETVR